MLNVNAKFEVVMKNGNKEIIEVDELYSLFTPNDKTISKLLTYALALSPNIEISDIKTTILIEIRISEHFDKIKVPINDIKQRLKNYGEKLSIPDSDIGYSKGWYEIAFDIGDAISAHMIKCAMQDAIENRNKLKDSQRKNNKNRNKIENICKTTLDCLYDFPKKHRFINFQDMWEWYGEITGILNLMYKCGFVNYDDFSKNCAKIFKIRGSIIEQLEKK